MMATRGWITVILA